MGPTGEGRVAAGKGGIVGTSEAKIGTIVVLKPSAVWTKELVV